MLTRPWTCRIGLHDYLRQESEKFTEPKRGPFDTRDDEARTFVRTMEICAQCGKKREYTWDDYPGL